MNEQTPRDPQLPNDPAGDGPADHDYVGANDPLPRDPALGDASRTDAADDATTRVHEAVPAAGGQRGRGILKPVLIGSAAALTVLAVAGVGMTIADAVDDGGDSSPSASSSPLASAPAPSAPGATDDPSTGPGGASEPGDDHDDDHGDDHGGARGGRGGDGDRGDDDARSGDASGTAASAAAPDLVAAIETAIAAAGGGSATSIEVEGGGWHVDVRLDDGSELDVRVPVSGDALVREDDRDDRSGDLALDTARIPAIVDAAVAAAGGGSVRSIESEDDDVRYEVEVAIDGDDTDVDLADDLSVLAVER